MRVRVNNLNIVKVNNLTPMKVIGCYLIPANNFHYKVFNNQSKLKSSNLGRAPPLTA